MDKNQLAALINAVENHEDFVLFQKMIHGQQLAEVYQELVTMFQASEQPQEEALPVDRNVEDDAGVEPGEHPLLDEEESEDEKKAVPKPPKPFRVKLR